MSIAQIEPRPQPVNAAPRESDARPELESRPAWARIEKSLGQLSERELEIVRDADPSWVLTYALEAASPVGAGPDAPRRYRMAVDEQALCHLFGSALVRGRMQEQARALLAIRHAEREPIAEEPSDTAIVACAQHEYIAVWCRWVLDGWEMVNYLIRGGRVEMRFEKP